MENNLIPPLAALAQNLTSASREIRILPPGLFRASDGRPVGLAGWKIDAASAARIVADLASRDDLVVDYEHQTLLAKENGQPAPAAGWFSRVVWREGEGLFAVDVKWTDKAKQMIAAREYRYISPVFSYNAVSGQVERLLALGLTNNPALSGLTDLAKIAANARNFAPSAERQAVLTAQAPSTLAYQIAKAATDYQTSQAARGIHVTTVQAVAKVRQTAPVKSTACAQQIADAAIQYQKNQADQGVYLSTVQAVRHIQQGAGITRR